jgi:lipopolysaccharide export system permease protein
LSLISRYILRETFGSFMLVLLVLLLIFMSNQFAEILGDAAADRLPRQAVFQVFGLTFLRYLTLLTPIGLLLGVMLALARLNRDSEMAALQACGVGPGKLVRPIGLISIVLAAGVAWLALVQMPEASRRIEEIRLAADEAMELGGLEAGKFITPDAGQTVLYAREVAGERLRGVFLQREQDGRVVVILADGGQRLRDPATGRLSFVLRDGRRYEGVPGETRFSIAEFREHGIPIRHDDAEEHVVDVAAKPTSELLDSNDPQDRAELEWRIATPLSVVILAALAIPLSRSSPREGRYARVGVAFLIYLIYVNSLSIARVWVERDLMASWLGLWWVHALLALFACWLLARQSGIGVRRKPQTVAAA